MNKTVFYIFGGADVHFKKSKRKIPKWLYLLLVMLLLYSSSAFAQGSIFGTVTNSDLTTPANGEISFYGFLDDTDEEIRIETSIGAGYDAGNWFDDFQNYLTEAPGNPYDYYFYNSTNGEGSILSRLIPSNSFQQEDITLGPVTWPGKPAGLTGHAVSGSSLIISWTAVAGETYHVYRRLATSSGSFFRIDDPAGSLANPGTSNGFFVDNTVNGTDSYSYMIIAEDGSGNLGPHSDPLTVNSAAVEGPIVAGIIPNAGSYVGGTAVTITGSNFDMNGVAVDIGGAALTSVAVVSPYEITGLTPAGVAGAVDVTVTNTASGLPSTPLVGGYTYLPNSTPVLAAIGAQSVDEAVNLNFPVTATDADGDPLTLYTSALPGTATFIDNGDGTGTFDWTPDFTDAGIYPVTFYATDDIDTVSELIDITVNDAGNQAPVLAAIGAQTVVEGGNLNLIITSSDPDGTIPSLTASDIPANATFADNGDGTGTFDFSPDLTQAGIYPVTFKAFDGALVDSEVVQIEVTNTNQVPVMASIGARSTDEQVNLNFTVTVTDGDGDPLTLYTSALPGTATFVDNSDGTGVFDWTPDFTESGVYPVTFYATDNIDTVSELVDITVNDVGNQAPVLDPIGPQVATEGVSLILIITASDPDGTIPGLFAESLPANASFVDSANGVGLFTFDPDFTQAGIYNVTFYASDGAIADTEIVEISVSESGNQPPIIAAVADTAIFEGDSLVMVVTANDPDGAGVLLTANTTLSTYNFVDSGNGVGVFSYYASYFDAGQDSIWFTAFDFETPPAVASTALELTITDVNQPPVINPIGPFGVAVDETLEFTIVATDSTDPITAHRLFLTAVGGPVNSSFVDNGDNTGIFTFTPDSTQAGVYSVTFIATDQGIPQQAYSIPVDITVVLENRPPVIDAGDAFTVWEGASLDIPVSATDPDGGFPQLRVTKSPDNTTFVDNGDGTGLITFVPDYTQSGLYAIVVEAYDGISVTKKNILVQVYEAGNQEPVIDPIPARNVTEGDTATIEFSAIDPDGNIPTLTVDSLPDFASFTDNGDGTGSIFIDPDFIHSGTYNIYILASDGELVDTTIFVLTIDDAGPQPPILEPVADISGVEESVIAFTVHSSDADQEPPVLTAENMPSGATFTDNNDFTGSFNWVTTFADSGTYVVKIVATDFTDPGIQDSIFVNIYVSDKNQPPLIALNPSTTSYTIFEGDNIAITVLTQDWDGTTAITGVDSATYQFVENMTFMDNGDGTGSFTFTPDFTQGNDPLFPERTFNTYYVQFVAIDGAYDTDTAYADPVQIVVYDKNQPPVLQVLYQGSTLTGDTLDFSVNEGETLEFDVLATDPDGVLPAVSAENLPLNSYFSGIFVYRKTFGFSPDFTQAGVYEVLFIGDDAEDKDTLVANITVIEAGNQAPLFTTTPSDTVVAVVDYEHVDLLTGFDPEGGVCSITVDTVLPYATFVDSGNGSATYTFVPNISQDGEYYPVTFTITDLLGASSTITTTYRVIQTMRGDANTDNQLNLLDVVFVINYLYKGGSSPASPDAADANYDGGINLMDATYLVNYFYKSGPPPPQ